MNLFWLAALAALVMLFLIWAMACELAITEIKAWLHDWPQLRRRPVGTASSTPVSSDRVGGPSTVCDGPRIYRRRV